MKVLYNRFACLYNQEIDAAPVTLLHQAGDGHAFHVRLQSPGGGKGGNGVNVVQQGVVPNLHKVAVQAVQVDAVPVVAVADQEPAIVPEVIGLQINRKARVFFQS